MTQYDEKIKEIERLHKEAGFELGIPNGISINRWLSMLQRTEGTSITYPQRMQMARKEQRDAVERIKKAEQAKKGS